jgi:hypothetical protein
MKLGLKEQVKKGKTTAKKALALLVEQGGSSSNTARWLERRLTKGGKL